MLSYSRREEGMNVCTPVSALAFLTNTELVPPWVLIMVSPFLIYNLNCFYLCASKVPAAGVEVIVTSMEGRVLGSMMC